MNVLLLRPPYTRPSYLARFTFTEALTEIFLGPVLAGRHAVSMVDLRVTPDLFAELGDFQPDVAVVAVMPLSRGALAGVLTRLKLRFGGIKVLLVGAAEYGSAHVVERPHDYMLDQADALIPGFYLAGLQRVVPAVVAAWEAGESLESIAGLWIRTEDGGWTATEHQPMLVGDIGVPDRTLLGRARGAGKLGGIGRMAYLMHSDGCRHACRYCTMSKSGGDIFVRRLPDVLAELQGITEPNVFIADFEPLQAPEAMLRLADSVEAERIRKKYFLLTRADSAVNHRHVLERWKEIGLRWVYIGIDGHSNARLREIGKGGDMAVNEAAVAAVKQLGLGLAVGITVPVDASREDFAAMAATARRLRAPMLGFTVETPLVGTRFFDDNEQRLTTRDWSLFDMYHATLPTRLPLDEFYRELARLQMLAWRLSTPGVLRHLPWRDILRNAWLGPGAMATQWRSAQHHGVGLQGVDPTLMEAGV